MSPTYIQVSGAAVPLNITAIKDSPNTTNVQQLALDELILITISDFDTAKKAVLWLYGYLPGDSKPPPVKVEEINRETWEELVQHSIISHKIP